MDDLTILRRLAEMVDEPHDGKKFLDPVVHQEFLDLLAGWGQKILGEFLSWMLAADSLVSPSRGEKDFEIPEISIQLTDDGTFDLKEFMEWVRLRIVPSLNDTRNAGKKSVSLPSGPGNPACPAPAGWKHHEAEFELLLNVLLDLFKKHNIN